MKKIKKAASPIQKSAHAHRHIQRSFPTFLRTSSAGKTEQKKNGKIAFPETEFNLSILRKYATKLLK
jgi:hypothetical protein